jgi:hypothetical protein
MLSAYRNLEFYWKTGWPYILICWRTSHFTCLPNEINSTKTLKSILFDNKWYGYPLYKLLAKQRVKIYCEPYKDNKCYRDLETEAITVAGMSRESLMVEMRLGLV